MKKARRPSPGAKSSGYNSKQTEGGPGEGVRQMEARPLLGDGIQVAEARSHEGSTAQQSHDLGLLPIKRTFLGPVREVMHTNYANVSGTDLQFTKYYQSASS